MFRNDRTRLSPSAAEALAAVREPIEQAEGLPHEAVVKEVDAATSGVLRADAIVSELLSKGYLYAVDDQLYVTPVE